MEFPHVGEQCSVASCKQLDFLPVKCDACHKIFCDQHYQYEAHNCTESYRKDNQVPVCPLCNTPIAVKRGELPDIKVGQHIDTDCQSDRAKQKRKIYTNRCSVKGCKQKELIPFNCEDCHKNFCIRHRLQSDHSCTGFENTGRGVSRAGAAAVTRHQATTSNGPFRVPASQPSVPQHTTMSSMGRDLDRERRMRTQQVQPQGNLRSLQAGLSEDEAMAQAIAASLATSQSTQPQSSSSQSDAEKRRQEEEDLALARALQESMPQNQAQSSRQSRSPREKKHCVLS